METAERAKAINGEVVKTLGTCTMVPMFKRQPEPMARIFRGLMRGIRNSRSTPANDGG
jgi:hypothetical protein